MKTFPFLTLFAVLICLSNGEETAQANNKITQESTHATRNKSFGILNGTGAEGQPGQRANESVSKQRQKRYSHALPWSKNEFTFSILKYTKDLHKKNQERIFKRAFHLWHKAAPQLSFKFVRSLPSADFKISFVKGYHGDNQPFDGRGPMLAHVFPPEDGRMHFDDDESFTDRSRFGVNLFSVALHEIGHVLGMKHSTNIRAAMHKTYHNHKYKNVKLDSDDIKGINALYRVFTDNDRGSPDQDLEQEQDLEHDQDQEQDKDQGCQDANRKLCENYRENGYCTPDFKDLMRNFCRLTCNLCDA